MTRKKGNPLTLADCSDDWIRKAAEFHAVWFTQGCTEINFDEPIRRESDHIAWVPAWVRVHSMDAQFISPPDESS